MTSWKGKYATVLGAGLLPARASVSFAATATPMPWHGPLMTLMDSITGPVAMVISLLGVAVCGGMLIFGGELGDFTRRSVMLVLVIALLTGSMAVLRGLFGGLSAAMVS